MGARSSFVSAATIEFAGANRVLLNSATRPGFFGRLEGSSPSENAFSTNRIPRRPWPQPSIDCRCVRDVGWLTTSADCIIPVLWLPSPSQKPPSSLQQNPSVRHAVCGGDLKSTEVPADGARRDCRDNEISHQLPFVGSSAATSSARRLRTIAVDSGRRFASVTAVLKTGADRKATLTPPVSWKMEEKDR